mmetsp:Transcript_20071/g.46765  ORF Transcript_20071/g.46765 Transcript_20071/m.46765 type:complete len:238 (-) Transcript_20071:66-779(-)
MLHQCRSTGGALSRTPKLCRRVALTHWTATCPVMIGTRPTSEIATTPPAKNISMYANTRASVPSSTRPRLVSASMPIVTLPSLPIGLGRFSEELLLVSVLSVLGCASRLLGKTTLSLPVPNDCPNAIRPQNSNAAHTNGMHIPTKTTVLRAMSSLRSGESSESSTSCWAASGSTYLLTTKALCTLLVASRLVMFLGARVCTKPWNEPAVIHAAMQSTKMHPTGSCCDRHRWAMITAA